MPATSRRTLLGSASLVIANGIACRITRDAAAQEKVNKAQAKYQDHPNGPQRCEICLNFQPPDQCRFVAGQINPKGWCQFFAARDNAE
ncbi:MAG TPA: hypothetical protein VJ779_14530 [Acetobacteraceae bacterium]|jgi:hypothetical protein|nr:hypothetical protein [Acetobacteraceae bacterium]